MTEEIEVSDFVMMNDITEQSMMELLKKRFENDKIYTLIRDVVVSVNPYKKLDIYSEKYIDRYRGKNIYELPPHIYSVADTAFLNLRDLGQDQCIIISGESGAGKTEASKLIMEYIAAVSGDSLEVDKVKSKLLESNPVLEAFGNAKTTRNDNSSRFGKYMDLQFDFLGNPIGGMITTYLLEKSRVVNPAKDERTFHIFYHLLGGADKALLDKLHLTSNFTDYEYLKKSNCSTVPGLNDKTQFDAILNALDCIGFKQDQKDTLFKCISAILHVGNIKYKKNENNDENVIIENPEVCKTIAELLDVKCEDLMNALTYRTVIDKNKSSNQKNIKVPLNLAKALSCQDTLAKTLYEKLFSWLVNVINENIFHTKDDGSHRSVIGVLDIYGFEIFQVNGFEQFTINYCNEKLQQLFIELTLKSEQEEYNNEGIQWENIDFFNNQIICDLIESKTNSIIALLNEECIRPGEKSDMTFLNKLNSSIIKNPHYDSREKTRNIKEIDINMFKIKHYAGDVVYTVDGFIEKNNDLLYNDISFVLNSSKNPHLPIMFPQNLENISLKSPETISTQFKNSMNQLIKNLTAKNPHYIRCIKPNNDKKSGVFDDELCLHQCRYLGLLENIRVRRAGYCFRKEFSKFVERFKLICEDTWPNWKGDPQEGVRRILKEANIQEEDYCFGKTKVFIKKPQIVFQLENIRNEQENKIATIIRANWLAYIYKKKYQKEINSIIGIQSMIRSKFEAQKYKKTIENIVKIQKYCRGFLIRKHMKREYLKLPKYCCRMIIKQWKGYKVRKMLNDMCECSKKASNWTSVQWPDEKYANDKNLKEPYEIFKQVYKRINAKKYRKSLTPDRKDYLEWKCTAMNTFSGKAGWKESATTQYEDDGLKIADTQSAKWKKICSDGSKIIQSFECTKFHRKNLKKEVPRKFVITENDLYLVDNSLGLKDKLPYSSINEIGCSTKKDGCIIFHTSNSKGDLMIRTDKNCIEVVSKICITSKNKGKEIKVNVSDSQNFNNTKKTIPIEFTNSDKPKLVVTGNNNKLIINVPN
ncbi:hypothetical protein BCR36DRAFT_582836 [Piromyces finnis]|uniref:Myosin motor domain-containing protein n=1 Tax=Piromyces finnis TaxID=1754191 RepID=A0A1Y1VCC0_9FUNG|nr:hypothetical protein BCR36DRAFT_582836 [Piromyces finnis]|eukprot:ORX51799.1 hypothetical protein BCR36DRAFT_582836 [Piromyces finnis]